MECEVCTHDLLYTHMQWHVQIQYMEWLGGYPSMQSHMALFIPFCPDWLYTYLSEAKDESQWTSRL